MYINESKVAINFTGLTGYPVNVPFDPPEHYPEYTGKMIDPTNRLYDEVRTLFYRMDLDNENYGTSRWNPLKDIVKPGMTVFIKPNTVSHVNYSGKDVLAVIIHASILRPVLDYVLIALGGEGQIIIADSQVINSRFDEAMNVSQIGALVAWYREQTSISIEHFDLRTVRGVRTWLYGRWGRKKVMQDPRGYTYVNLGDKSQFRNHDPKRLRITVASWRDMMEHHSGGKHEYLIPNSFLASDVVISLPKLKTHRRTAITVALKNFMGIPASKESLPHFVIGSPEEGGDQYIHPSRRKRIGTYLHDIIQTSPYVPVKFVAAVIKNILWNSHLLFPFKDDIYEGMWPGNDTIWRLLLDLNRIVFYADKYGKISENRQRNSLFLVDGIIGGDGDGPVSPDPVSAGVLIGGVNPIAVDAVASAIMGFNPEKIPLVKNALTDSTGSIPEFGNTFDEIQINDSEGVIRFEQLHETCNTRFNPHPNWKGYIEY